MLTSIHRYEVVFGFLTGVLVDFAGFLAAGFFDAGLVAPAAGFLAAVLVVPAAGFLTGGCLVVDAGLTAGAFPAGFAVLLVVVFAAVFAMGLLASGFFAAGEVLPAGAGDLPANVVFLPIAAAVLPAGFGGVAATFVLVFVGEVLAAVFFTNVVLAFGKVVGFTAGFSPAAFATGLLALAAGFLIGAALVAAGFGSDRVRFGCPSSGKAS